MRSWVKCKLIRPVQPAVPTWPNSTPPHRKWCWGHSTVLVATSEEMALHDTVASVDVSSTPHASSSGRACHCIIAWYDLVKKLHQCNGVFGCNKFRVIYLWHSCKQEWTGWSLDMFFSIMVLFANNRVEILFLRKIRSYIIRLHLVLSNFTLTVIFFSWFLTS